MADIHQDVTFDTTPDRLYQALTDPEKFAAWTGMEASISPEEGGAFSCFGVYILGRNIELVQDQRIVQAWRAFNWEEGVYAVVRFELRTEGSTTRLVFDQSGVPADAAEHVDTGWHNKYWNHLREWLSNE